MIDYAGSRWRYVPINGIGGVTARGATPSGTTVELQLTELPVGGVVAALVNVMVRDSTTASIVLSIYDGRDRTTRVGFVGTSGYAARGSGGTAFIVPVGGTNGRSIGVGASTSATGTYWVTVMGYFVVDSGEPVSGEVGPVDAPLPVNPSPGDPMTADWARSMIAMAGKGWAYHHIPEAASAARNTAGTWTEVAPAAIPADAVAASCYLRLRASDTANIVGAVYDGDGNLAGAVYSAGVAARYAVTGHFVVFLDASRQFRISLGAAVQEFHAVFTGYWTKDA
jgi:hypothetical protein